MIPMGMMLVDRVLQNIAEIARKEMRCKDILARFGGESLLLCSAKPV